MNCTFRPHKDNISLNSRDEVYLFGGEITLCQSFYRFEWSITTQRGEPLHDKMLNHEWSNTGEIFIVKISDLESGNLYQIHSSRQQVAAHPESAGPESWSCGPQRCPPPYMYTKGMNPRTQMSVLANLDVSENGRNPIQSFAWISFRNDGLVVSRGQETALVRFSGSNAKNESKPKELPLKPNAPATWATPPTTTAFEVRAPAHEHALHAQVVAGLVGPFHNWCRAADPSFTGNATGWSTRTNNQCT